MSNIYAELIQQELQMLMQHEDKLDVITDLSFKIYSIDSGNMYIPKKYTIFIKKRKLFGKWKCILENINSLSSVSLALSKYEVEILKIIQDGKIALACGGLQEANKIKNFKEMNKTTEELISQLKSDTLLKKSTP